MTPSRQPQRVPFSFTLQMGGEKLSVTSSVPEGECAVEELVPILLSLGEEVVTAAIRQRPEGRQISCGAGCGACCRQLVPISLSEAGFLRKQVLPNLKKSHRLRVKQRLADTVSALEKSGLWNDLRDLPKETDPERRQAIGLRYFLSGIPCPFLENESCSIHPQRPLACREYLVMSPATRCARPDNGGIEPVAIPQKPSHALIQIDAEETGTPGWRTMIDALLNETATPARIIPDPIQFLRNFLSHLLK